MSTGVDPILTYQKLIMMSISCFTVFYFFNQYAFKNFIHAHLSMLINLHTMCIKRKPTSAISSSKLYRENHVMGIR
jgi:hypothetical protein